MNEIIITVVVQATSDEPAHTVVWRVEVEGAISAPFALGNVLEMSCENVVSVEQLTAK